MKKELALFSFLMMSLSSTAFSSEPNAECKRVCKDDSTQQSTNTENQNPRPSTKTDPIQGRGSI